MRQKVAIAILVGNCFRIEGHARFDCEHAPLRSSRLYLP
jgi:hypothetical protein